MAAALDLLRSLMQRGGPVMWPIALCALATLFVTIRKLLQWLFYTIEVLCGRARWRQALQTLADPAAREALRHCQKAHLSPYLILLREALNHPELSPLEALRAGALAKLRSLARGLGLLDTIVTLAPMLGILGTVTGIIAAFNLMGSSGVDDPTGIAAGIAEALITTAAGLVVSILALLPLNAGRVCHKTIAINLQQAMTAAEEKLTLPPPQEPPHEAH